MVKENTDCVISRNCLRMFDMLRERGKSRTEENDEKRLLDQVFRE